MRLTQAAYQRHLDANSPEDSNAFIIGGKLRLMHFYAKRYGEALRKHDPIAFRVGFNEWKREQVK